MRDAAAAVSLISSTEMPKEAAGSYSARESGSNWLKE